ncbi:hypothetical protein QN277_003153 [Acacia crassicarpa]|uniref:DUF4408 domain-containing protein n=1 Tax=Acacia crassicarpa TaxID=499986 RepID=A0AAE1MC45_9FABA|nr:hypothetical protein QN277_003153 [Acacia crassicarpa]
MDDSFNFPNLFSLLTKTIRFLELCLVLLLLSWILPRLPFALSFLRHFSLFLSSPLFVFLLSNAIIATLVVNSGTFSPPADSPVSQYSLLNKNTAPAPQPDPLLRVAEGEVVYQDKHMISDTNPTVQDKADTVASKDTGLHSDFATVYRRTVSEKFTEEERMQPKLRRSETEKKHMENRRENMYPQDKLSNEEFQRTIEAFIAKQMRFLREESLAINVIQNQS